MDPESLKYIAISIIGSLGLLGPAIGLGIIGSAALSGVSRNPEAKGAIFSNMILIAGLTEAVAIYALIIAVLLIFVV